MKKEIYRSDSRGFADHGWLKTKHLFSFANYHDPHRMHFGKIRVLNDDIVAPGAGFGMHSHSNMEIVSIPLQGNLIHKDDQGNTSKISTGEIQIMSAGTGIWHSEYNASDDEEVHFLQIWIFPEKEDIPPRYDQIGYDLNKQENSFLPLVSPIKNKSSLWINQNAYLSLGKFNADRRFEYHLKNSENGVLFFLIKGAIIIDKEHIQERDSIAVHETTEIQLATKSDSTVLAIETPMH